MPEDVRPCDCPMCLTNSTPAWSYRPHTLTPDCWCDPGPDCWMAKQFACYDLQILA